MAITNFGFVPPTTGLLADGETVTVRYTITNNNADKSTISRVISQLRVRFSEVYTPITDTQTVYFSPLAYGKSVTLSIRHVVDLSIKGSGSGLGSYSTAQYFRQNPDVRFLGVYLAASGVTHTVGRLLNARYSPGISKFELQRALDGDPNDEGENLLSSVNLAAASGCNLPVILYYAQEPDVPKLQQSFTHPEFGLESDTWLGYAASASSVYSADYAAYNAFDRYPYNSWRSSSNASAPWIQLKLPQKLYDIKVTVANDSELSPAKGMTAGTIYGVSDDGVTLTQIGSFSGRDGATTAAESTITCTNSEQGFRIVRIKATSWNGSSYVSVGQITITGNKYPASQISANVQAIDLSDKLSDMLFGVNNSASLISETFSNGVGWNFLLVFGDEYEQVTASLGIARAFANLHLSGYSTGGACFGGFCTSTQDNPKLESYFPAHLYGGIAKIGKGWQELEVINGTSPAEYGGGKLRCRKIEDKCIIDGSVLVKPASSAVLLAKLPEGFTPACTVFSLNPCSGGRIARVMVQDVTRDYPGYLALEWVRDISDGGKYTSELWVQCSIEYWVDPPAEDVLLCGEAVCNTTTVVGKVL